MGSWSSDKMAATELAVDAWKRLNEVNPEHELVKFLVSEDVSDEAFNDRFWDKKRALEKQGRINSINSGRNKLLLSY